MTSGLLPGDIVRKGPFLGMWGVPTNHIFLESKFASQPLLSFYTPLTNKT